MSATLHIHALLSQRRPSKAKMRSASHVSAEVKLLFNEAVNHLTSIIERTADDDFAMRYHRLINLPHNRAPYYNYVDLLETLAPKKSLVISQPGKRGDVLWTSGEQDVPTLFNGVWPFPRDASEFIVPPHQRHIRRTREDVLDWDRVALMVPESNVQALVRFLRKGGGGMLAIVAADDGVCVIFRIEAHDYVSWQDWARLLHKTLAEAGVHAEKASLSTLVPISRESRGRGALLYHA